MTIAAVVLAAGGGRRWNGRGHKLLALMNGTPIFEHSIRAAADAALDELVVVTGAVELCHDVLQDAVVLHNPAWAEGQASSIQIALDHCQQRNHQAAVFGLADTPGVPAQAWSAVASEMGDLVCATFGGERRPPVKVGSIFWDELPKEGDEGARVLLHRRASVVVDVACSGQPADIDTLEDLRQWS